MTLSRFERAEESPGFLLWQLTNLWQQRMRAALAPLGLTHVQFVLLASAAWLEQSGADVVSQAMLSRHAHTDVMMTSQVVRALEEKSLLTRSAHPTDPRAKAVALTEEGRALARRAMTVVEDADERFFHPLDGDVASFARLARLLVAAHAKGQPSTPAEE